MSQITNLLILQKYTRVSNDFKVDQIEPFENLAHISYLNNFFQKELIDAVFAFSSADENTSESRMYEALMSALVNFTMYEYSNQGEITVSDNGILRAESDHAKTAYSGQVKKYQASLMDAAFHNVGFLIDLLEKLESGDLQELWIASPAFANRSGLLVRSAIQFNSIQRLYRYQTTFIDLIPILRNVQELFMVPGIGETLLSELVQNASDMDANKKIARTFLCTALVNITMAQALTTGMVHLTPAGVISIGQDKDTSYQIEEKGLPEHVSVSHSSYMDIGLRYIDKAKKHLAASGFIQITSSAARRFRV